MHGRNENNIQGIILRNGVNMPLLGFGVLQMKDPEECERCVREAFENGYRMFDTAASYGNERAVGNALKKIMEELGVQPQAWAPLCEGLKNIFSNKILEKIGKKYGKTAAQTALRWNIDRGVSVVTRSCVPEHMREDQDIWDFSLTEAEKRTIGQLDLGYSEILDYGNPCIARMFLKKYGLTARKNSGNH